VEKFGSNNPLTALVPKLIDVDPDDSFSAVPYEKGFSLLYLLETLFGLDEMKSYLRAHVEQFKYRTIDTDQWKEFLFKHFEQKGMVGKLEGIDWNSWFYAPGMPPLKPKFNESLSVVCTELANRWANTPDGSEFSGKDLDSFTSTQIQEFLNQLLNKPNPLSVEILKRFDEVYKMNERTNSEIKFRWLRLALKGRHTDVFPNVVKFLTEQGRMKFVRPLYSELHGCPNGGKELAVDTFVANRHIYHGIAANMIAKDLKL
jgi:leukotriene-A4 hydrolase